MLHVFDLCLTENCCFVLRLDVSRIYIRSFFELCRATSNRTRFINNCFNCSFLTAGCMESQQARASSITKVGKRERIDMTVSTVGI